MVMQKFVFSCLLSCYVNHHVFALLYLPGYHLESANFSSGREVLMSGPAGNDHSGEVCVCVCVCAHRETQREMTERAGERLREKRIDTRERKREGREGGSWRER